MDSHEDEFRSILDELEESAHGSSQLQKVTQFLRGLKKRKRDFLRDRLLQRAIPWNENKERGNWKTEEEAEKNLYWLLQGYLVESNHVVGPNGVEENGLWLVLSVDCDCVRAPYVNVAKTVPVTDTQEDRERLSLATAFANTKFFPIPPFGENGDWSFVDLQTPFHIEREKVPFTVAVASLTIDAWHLLNAVLQARHTRSLDIDEAKRLRRE